MNLSNLFSFGRKGVYVNTGDLPKFENNIFPELFFEDYEYIELHLYRCKRDLYNNRFELMTGDAVNIVTIFLN